ncbi:MAG TPA: DegQ family serine endoprotease [Nevskiaceae bacterium]|nr:DegQ family serine endoprotease [Nevskiaceae bacterium]
MSRATAIRIFAPLAVSASLLAAAFMMSSAPSSVSAGSAVVGATATNASLPLTAGVPSLAPMLKEVMPSVVNIAVTSKQQIRNPLMDDPFFRRFFGAPDDEEQQQPEEQEAQAIGSGVIVDAEKGYVITNNHVVDGADTIKVRLSDDREFDAKLIGKDPQTDVAVLQIKADHLHAIPVGDSSRLEVGDFVVAIGSPFNLRQTVTSGIVSGLSRRTGISEGGYEDFIQTDASINPGNSGGALVNLRGELIGIPSNILSRSGGNIGIGFAIPVNLAKGVMTQLIATGAVERGRIGVFGQDLTPELAKAFGLTSTHGAVVTKVVPKSPADKAGIKTEDVILAINGHDVEDFAQLRNTVGLMRIGETVDLKIQRDGKTRNVSVTISKDVETVKAGGLLHPKLKGATFAPVDERNAQDTDGLGVIVQKIEPRSPAAHSGLKEGDIIVGVNRHPVSSYEEFTKLVDPKQAQLLLNIRRGGGALFILLQ